MEIELLPDTEALVRARLDSGLYLDASDVIRDALRHMFEQDVELEHLRAAIAEGEAEVERGETTVWTDTSLAEIADEDNDEDRPGQPIDGNVQP